MLHGVVASEMPLNNNHQIQRSASRNCKLKTHQQVTAAMPLNCHNQKTGKLHQECEK
jgi:hypothetical protein